MAFATPYDLAGISIHVFYNRVMEDHRELRGPVLGHVLAHEMGHALEGVARHSAGGLMKAYWQTADYSQMSKKRLYFAAEDVELMHLSLLRRSESALTASAGRE
jgi:predicted metalloendopeptidase